MGALGVLLTIIEVVLIFNIRLFIIFVTSVALTSALGFILYKAGLMGGADIKGLIVLSAMFPYYPLIDYIPIFPVYPTFIVSVFENSVLLSILSVAYFTFKNLYLMLKGEKLFNEKLSIFKKLLLICTCSKYDVLETDWKKVYPIEIVDYSVDPPRKVFSFISNVNADIDANLLIKAYKEGYLDRKIWGTLGIPMIIFISIGLIITILFGDMILALINLLFRFI